MRPESQLTVMGVTLRRKMVGGPKLANEYNGLSWYRYIDAGFCLHSYDFLFRLVSVPVI